MLVCFGQLPHCQIKTNSRTISHVLLFKCLVLKYFSCVFWLLVLFYFFVFGVVFSPFIKTEKLLKTTNRPIIMTEVHKVSLLLIGQLK